MSKSSWQKWGRSFITSVIRHVGTAGATWMGTNTVLGHSVPDTLDTLPKALLFGAILPTVWTFFQKAPDLDDDEVKPPTQ